ncbi:hypothetical protein ACFQ0B_10195 [Nonomuraea thailandensis]
MPIDSLMIHYRRDGVLRHTGRIARPADTQTLLELADDLAARTPPGPGSEYASSTATTTSCRCCSTAQPWASCYRRPTRRTHAS